MFYFGTKGRELVGGTLDAKITTLTEVFHKKLWVQKVTPLLAYIYMGFLPLPNDILLLFLATIKFPVKTTVWIILLGDLTFVAVLIGAALALQ